MKQTTKNYKVSTFFSTREIQTRTKKEAINIFKSQLKGLVSESDKISVK